MCLVPFPGQGVYHKCSIFTPQVPSLIPRPVCISIYAGRTRVIEQDYPCTLQTQPTGSCQVKTCVCPHMWLWLSQPPDQVVIASYHTVLSAIRGNYMHFAPPQQNSWLCKSTPMGTRCYQVCILFLVTQPVKME